MSSGLELKLTDFSLARFVLHCTGEDLDYKALSK